MKVDVKLSDRVKPIQAEAAGQVRVQARAHRRPGPLDRRRSSANIRNEQEQILVELIDQTPDTEVEEKSDYYFRLGELYAKQQRCGA